MLQRSPADPLEQSICVDTWREKYRYKDELDYAATCARVATTLCKNESPAFAKEAYRAMVVREIVPAGRILAGAGTDKRVTLINCLAGTEKLLTKEHGAIALAEVSGRAVTVLTQDGWRPATVRQFGKQPLQRIMLRPAWRQFKNWRVNSRSTYEVAVNVTPDHRWVLEDGTITTSLRVGDVIESCARLPNERSRAYLEGLRHGLVFGDGSYYGDSRIGSVHGVQRHHRHILRLCGVKAAYVDVFDEMTKEKSAVNYALVNYPPSAKGDPVIGYYADINCKELPEPGLDDDYYGGFVDGWFAADGHAEKRGGLWLHSQDKCAVDWLVEHAPVAGFLVSGCRVVARAGEITSFGRRSADMWMLTLRRAKQMKWKVTSIAKRGAAVVYCAVVPGVGAFTLARGVYTGNCFTSPTIQDSMRTESGSPGAGIMDALSVASYTQQMGGGIGMDFSTIRPRGAKVFRTGSVSSGVMPFMDMWDAMCATIRSSGSRRGAMMGTLGIWHPDIEEFITAKQTKGHLTNFNVSVLVTDAFMEAVEKDSWWDLWFDVPRGDGQHANQWQREEGGLRYAYRRVSARELWDKIIQATYVYAEPGVLFIDRVNQLNNLSYCEHIHCCNPCGEQFLPDNGDCNLGHTNLAVMVDRPFEPDAEFRFDKLKSAAEIMVRLLDNVLDATMWPTEEQRAEAAAKRRIGLGFTGLASALQQLGIPYGSAEAVNFTRNVARTQAVAAYGVSCQLAKERGAFPLFDSAHYCRASFVHKLPAGLQKMITNTGIRNGILLSIAPTGTTSLVVGNVSSGIEPVFAHKYRRKVRGGSGELENEYSVYDYGYLKYCEKEGLDPERAVDRLLPRGFVTADQLTVEQHLQMAAAAQEWVDSAISKTINCPTSMALDEFEGVYTRAYALGMKGCTTYRPDLRSGRGSVLEAERSEPPQHAETAEEAPRDVNAARRAQPVVLGKVVERKISEQAPPSADKLPMQDVVEGRRYRIKWPSEDCAYYVVITDCADAAGRRRPFELFISTKSERHSEWVKAFSLLVTAIFRREGDPSFVVDELRSVFSATGGTWIRVPWADKPKLATSLVAAIGFKIEEHMRWLGLIPPDEPALAGPLELPAAVSAADAAIDLMPAAELLDVCIHCGARAVVYSEGCATCHACGRSDCG